MELPESLREEERLAALRRYAILDTKTEPDFDDLAQSAARLCGTPIALVSFVDANRQWFKARVGLDLPETSRAVSFCAHALASHEPLVVNDATLDERFRNNPLVVEDPKIRFYAGAPLITPRGHVLGTLCVVDFEPRQLGREQLESLMALGRQVIAQLELRRVKGDLETALGEAAARERNLREMEALNTRIIETSRDCIKVLDLEGKLLSMNASGMEQLEICALEPILGTSWIDFWQGDDRRQAEAAVAAARSGGVGRFVGFFPTQQTGRRRYWDVFVHPLLNDAGEPEKLLADSRDVTESHEAETLLEALAAGTASSMGGDFFSSLVRYLTSALGARYAFVAECDSTGSRAHALAFWSGDGPGEPFEFDVAGTPCRLVLEGQTAHYTNDLPALFPEDVGLIDLGARSYLGVPMVAADGSIVGHLAVIDDKPMPEDARKVAILKIFAARAAAELLRERADADLRDAMAQVQELKNQLQAENLYLQEEIRDQHNFEEIVGASRPLGSALETVEVVAATDTTVLITGETGTGKELIARALHDRSDRRDRPLVKVNCAAISAGLVESELFGHVKGAFTGALERRVGRFELADRGTIFLDEIGELPLETQAKLLRVLQEQEFEPVGSSRSIRVDVRILAATNRDLEERVRVGAFRSDLFFRLNVVPIHLPALRERPSDIPLLVDYFLTRLSRKFGKRVTAVSEATLARMTRYAWPGNVRELQNVLERAVVLSRGPVLEIEGGLLGDGSPPPASARAPAARSPAAPSPDGSNGEGTLEDVERRHILSVLERTGGVIEGLQGAAKILDLHPNTLRSRMKKLGVRRPGS